jgi:hypothetical protein
MNVQRRAGLGALIGFIFFAIDAVATLIRLTVNPLIAERATGGSLLAMLLYLLLFIGGGALAGYLWSIEVALLRFMTIGAIVGALIWSYLTATWPLTARASAMVVPQMSAVNGAFLGAIGGSLGGALLFAIYVIRRRNRNFHR